jgi:AraC-like DNA-binding protein
VVEQQKVDVAYWEMHGRIDTGTPRPPGHDVVVLSNIDRCAETSPGAPGLSIRFVGRGSENYRIDGRAYRIDAGQVMIAPHESGAECEVRRVERAGTLGVCTLIRKPSVELDWVCGPLVVSAECTPLGTLLKKAASDLWTGQRAKLDVARQLMAGLRSELPAVAGAVLGQAAAIEAARPATRYEIVRRAHLAQAVLHGTLDRAIPLEELATEVGTSAFALLRAFQSCFGETPAIYHRKLRLTRALEEAERRKVPIGFVADEFGFSGSSGFSHAYRRSFGRAPVWTKGMRPAGSLAA